MFYITSNEDIIKFEHLFQRKEILYDIFSNFSSDQLYMVNEHMDLGCIINL